MTEVNAKEYAVVETWDPQGFRFAPRYHITDAFLAVMVIGLVLVAWVPFVIISIADGRWSGPFVRATLYCTMTFLCLALFGRMGRRELDKVMFFVSAEGISRCDPYRKKNITWGSITAVRYRRPPFAKGCVEITSGRTTLVLPSTIMGFGRLGRALRKGLESAGKTSLCPDALLHTMAVMGEVNEQWNERARAAAWPLIAATIGGVLFNSFIAACVWQVSIIPLVIWTGICLPVPLLIFSIADIRLNRDLEKTLMQNERTPPRQNIPGELITGSLIVMPLYGLAGILLKEIFHP